MDIRSHEVIERRRDGNNNDHSNSNNNNDNNYNGNNLSVSCTTQTLDHHHPKSPSSLSLSNSTAVKTVRYRECLKNHAASAGGSVQDGCGEFMPGGDEGTIEALKCAACDCHRNFHRKEVDGSGGGYRMYGSSAAVRPHPPPGMSIMMNPLMLPPPPSYHHKKYGMVTPMSVAYGGGGAESSSEDLNLYGQSSGEYGVAMATQTHPQPPFSMTRKRFRTKFTSEQKERMTEFAEKLGWRMNKQDEEELERFCAEVGVKRQVFKVWMHNNKNNIKKQQSI